MPTFPFMKPSKRTLWHIAAWALYLLYQEMEEFIREGWEDKDLAYFFSMSITRILIFYLFYSLIWPRFLQAGRWPLLLLLAPLGILLFPALRYAIEEVAYPALLGFGNYKDPTVASYLRDNLFWRALPITAASLIVYLLEQRWEAQRRHRELLKEKTASELAFLRSQLNPHFLFNTLSYLHTEAIRVSPALADTVLELSDMLRYSLHSARKERAPIDEEVRLVHNYLAIFEKRFKGRFFVQFTAGGQALSQKVEPLLLIPFFENAFKHGLTSDPERPARFRLKVEPGRMHFSSFNYIRAKEKDAAGGIGLENVKRRLELCYPGRYNLAIVENKDTFKVDLKLKL